MSDVLLVFPTGESLLLSERTALAILSNGKTRFTYTLKGSTKVFTIVSF